MAEEKQEKPADQAAKPAAETKPAAEAKPAAETKPAAEAKPAAETKPAAEAKPAAAGGKPAVGKAAFALRPQQLVLVGAIVVAVGAGIAGGLFLLGPRLAAMRVAAAADPGRPEEPAGEEPAGHGAEKGKGKHGKEAARAAAYRLDNLIVNPAGSGGTRFLMASVVVEVPDPKIEARLRERDFQVRDAVIAVLERQTLESITGAGGRDSVKRRLAATLQPMVGRGVPVTIYLPQFVIQ